MDRRHQCADHDGGLSAQGEIFALPATVNLRRLLIIRGHGAADFVFHRVDELSIDDFRRTIYRNVAQIQQSCRYGHDAPEQRARFGENMRTRGGILRDALLQPVTGNE